MGVIAKFAHINIVAKDWKALATFYEQTFGCTRIPPERDLSGKWLEDATGVPEAALRGIHLRLPGCGETGPTLEIFQYQQQPEKAPTVIYRPGLAHIAFAVDDVAAAREAVLHAGGGEVGKLTSVDIPEAGQITFVYLTDPEGNILELQQWQNH